MNSKIKFKKIIIFIFFILFISADIFVIFYPHKRPFWWPLITYPMYAHGMHPNDELKFYELKVKDPSSEEMISVNYEMLHIMPARFNSFLRSTAAFILHTHPNDANIYSDFNYFNSIIKKYMPACKNAELWYKAYRITENGIKDFNVDWKQLGAWKID